jgi:hypothetical protein
MGHSISEFTLVHEWNAIVFGSLPLARILLYAGGALTAIAAVAYVIGNSTLNLITFFYGVPVLLGGLALKAAELKPAPYKTPTSPAVVALRDRLATPTQNQVRKDVTRYRYGEEAHLSLALERLGLAPTDPERPKLVSVEEADLQGDYGLILEFESPKMPFETWQTKRDKIERFFGPNLRAEVAQGEGAIVVVSLISPAPTA